MKKIMLLMLILIVSLNMFGVAETATDFNAKDINGKNIQLSKFKGKVVILDFWATWCRPCINEIPNLKNIYKKFKNEKFEIISIALERKPSEYAIGFVKENKMGWIHIIDKDKGREIATAYKIRYIPSMFVLNSKGEIVATGLRGESLLKKISELLK